MTCFGQFLRSAYRTGIISKIQGSGMTPVSQALQHLDRHNLQLNTMKPSVKMIIVINNNKIIIQDDFISIY